MWVILPWSAILKHLLVAYAFPRWNCRLGDVMIFYPPLQWLSGAIRQSAHQTSWHFLLEHRLILPHITNKMWQISWENSNSNPPRKKDFQKWCLPFKECSLQREKVVPNEQHVLWTLIIPLCVFPLSKHMFKHLSPLREKCPLLSKRNLTLNIKNRYPFYQERLGWM